jgi:hypothetical protein
MVRHRGNFMNVSSQIRGNLNVKSKAIPSQARKGRCRDLTASTLTSDVEGEDKVQTTNGNGSEN